MKNFKGLFNKLNQNYYTFTQKELDNFMDGIESSTENEFSNIRKEVTQEFNNKIIELENKIDIQRKDYSILEEKYIMILQRYEILWAKQIKNKNLASEIFGDDDD